MSFYSKREMKDLKDRFIKDAGNTFTWSEQVNPHAYNPSFMSESGTYSFDLILVTIKSNMSKQDNLLAKLKVVKTRTNEISPVVVKFNFKKYVTVEHEKLTIITSPGFYQEHHSEKQNSAERICFQCKTPSLNYYNVITRVGGKSPVHANVQFCPDHVPETKKDWEEKLKEPWSPWSNEKPCVYTFFLVGQGIAKTGNASNNHVPLKAKL